MREQKRRGTLVAIREKEAFLLADTNVSFIMTTRKVEKGI